MRVIQWATGHVGQNALKGILDHPELELVGVRVYGPSKEGKDAGELCGRDPVGVTATRDVDALLALDADCVCYTAIEDDGIEPVVDEWCRILRSGKNIVASTLLPLVYPDDPPARFAEAVKLIQEAAAESGKTVHVAGLHPGFMCDVLPAIVSGGCRQIEHISVSENYESLNVYDEPHLLRDLFGFGTLPEEDKAVETQRLDVVEDYWGSTLKLLAALLGGEIGGIERSREVAITDTVIELPGLRIEPGTIGGIHLQLDALVGKTKLTLHEYALAAAHAKLPHWPPPPKSGGYRVEIVGKPNVQVDITFEGPDEDPLDEAFVYTALRLVNSIPAACRAEPGFESYKSILRAVSGPAMAATS